MSRRHELETEIFRTAGLIDGYAEGVNPTKRIRIKDLRIIQELLDQVVAIYEAYE